MKPAKPPPRPADHVPDVRKMVVTFDLSYADYEKFKRDQAAEPKRH